MKVGIGDRLFFFLLACVLHYRNAYQICIKLLSRKGKTIIYMKVAFCLKFHKKITFLTRFKVYDHLLYIPSITMTVVNALRPKLCQ